MWRAIIPLAESLGFGRESAYCDRNLAAIATGFVFMVPVWPR
jgi:hypothetical protein